MLFFQNGARFNNAGTFLAQNDTDLRNQGGAASLFNNSGTFTRDTGTGDFTISIPFDNSGTVNVATGTLPLDWRRERPDERRLQCGGRRNARLSHRFHAGRRGRCGRAPARSISPAAR